MGARSLRPAAAPAAAVALGALTFGLAVAGLPLDSAIHQPGSPLDDAVTILLMATGTAMGTLLAVRLPRNPVGWLLLAIFGVVAAPCGQHAVLDYRVHHGTWPLGGVALALLGDWPVFLVLIVCLIWLFPDGSCRGGDGALFC